MSRRKKATDRIGAPGSRRVGQLQRRGATLVRIVCTDRGQHSPVRFGDAEIKQLPSSTYCGIQLQNEFNHYESAIAAIERGEDVPDRMPRTWNLQCQRCGRTVPLKASTIESVCVRLAAAGFDTFDVSTPLREFDC